MNEDLIKKIKGLKNNLVKNIINKRFEIRCEMKIMKMMGEIE
jgi:hypothetical protein